MTEPTSIFLYVEGECSISSLTILGYSKIFKRYILQIEVIGALKFETNCLTKSLVIMLYSRKLYYNDVALDIWIVLIKNIYTYASKSRVCP